MHIAVIFTDTGSRHILKFQMSNQCEFEKKFILKGYSHLIIKFISSTQRHALYTHITYKRKCGELGKKLIYAPEWKILHQAQLNFMESYAVSCV